jgi:hypothetical protein
VVRTWYDGARATSSARVVRLGGTTRVVMSLSSSEEAGGTTFLTEQEYETHSSCASWLQRRPPPLVLPPQAQPLAALPAACDEDALPGPALRHSALSWEEHAWLLQAQQATKLSKPQEQRRARLAAAAASEVEAFLRDRAAGGVDKETLCYCHSEVAAAVELLLAGRREQELRLPRFLTPFARWQRPAAAAATLLQHKRTLSRAKAGGKLLHALPQGTHLPTTLSPVADKLPLAEDARAAALAAAEGANVVLVAAAFARLADAQPGAAWELPVVVRLEGAARVALVDGPLLPARLSPRTRNELFYKARLS